MCGSDRQYLRQLSAAVRDALGSATYVYTTDPPWLLHKGSLPGPEVYTCAPAPTALRRLSQGYCCPLPAQQTGLPTWQAAHSGHVLE